MYYLERDVIIKERYKVIEVLNRGSFSTSCIVLDEHNGKTYFLKELSSSYSEFENKEVFISYIISIKDLKHSFLPELRDSFQYKNKYCIVMEYIEGRTIEDLIKEEKLPLNEIDVLDLGIKISELISYLHSQEKDIMISLEPSHIILDKRNNPRLINFRFDKILIDSNNSQVFNGYISPEEYSGISENDERSDVYSLGVIMHQLLTGIEPSINPFKFYPVKKINPSVTDKTSSFISKATTYSPSVRYKDGIAFKEALKLCLKDAENQAKSAPSLSRLIKEQKKPSVLNKIMILFVAILFLFIIFSFIADFFKKDKESDSPYDLKLEGIKSYNRAEYSIAIGYLTKYLSLQPDDGEAIIYKENSYLNIKNNMCLDIAVAGSFSGNNCSSGKAMLQGVALAQKIINAEKRIPDYSIRIILKDDKGDTSIAGNIATEIVCMDSIIGVIGHTEDNTTLAAGPVYNRSGLPQIIPSCSKNNSGGYNIANSDPVQVKMLAKYSVLDRGSKRIILIYSDSDYYKDFINLYKFECIKLGGEIVKTVSIHKLINSEIADLNGDLVFIAGDIESVKSIYNNLKEKHLRIQCLVAGSQMFLINPDEDSLQGIFFTTLFNAETNDINSQKFVQIFTDNFGGTVPNSINALSYDATLIMARAISEGGIKRENIKNYLSSLGEKIPPFIGVTGVTSFDKTGGVQKDMLLINIKDHMFHPVGILSI